MKKLQADLDTKMAQRDELKEKSRLKREGNPNGSAANDNADDSGGDDDALFGESGDGMEIV